MKNLSLSIPKPCSEKWENFTSAAQGALCNSCNKVVIDFTTMSNEEVFDYFSRKNDHTCGRFRPHQLTAYTTSSPVRINPGMTLLKAGFLSLLMILISRQVSAQDNTSKTKTEIVDKRAQQKSGESTDLQTGTTLKGIVLAEGNEPMPGASIILKGSAIEIIADAHGRFEFPQKVKEGDVIGFYFIGYESQEYIVPKNAGNELQITMVCDASIMGEVAVNTVYAPSQSPFRKLWWQVKNLF